MDGTLKGFGDDMSMPTPIPTLDQVTINGNVTSTGQIVAWHWNKLQVLHNLGGQLLEQGPSLDFQNVEIDGSILATGIIKASAAGTLDVVGDMDGKVYITGALGTLDVGGNVNGTVAADSIGVKNIGGQVFGQIITGQPGTDVSGVQLSYNGPGSALDLVETEPGVNLPLTVVVSEPSPNVLLIDLGASEAFDPSSTAVATGLSYQNGGSPVTSEYATIDLGTPFNVGTLPDHADGRHS